MSVTVTATQGGSSANGMALRVMVLTGTAGNPYGATAIQSGFAAHEASITTTVTGSRVYGAATNGANIAFVAEDAATTLLDNIADATNADRYGTFRATSATGTPGATLLGCKADTDSGGAALLEVLPNGTIAEDSSSPAVVSTLTATSVTTASFDPPPGSLLVAMVSADGSSATCTMAVSGGGLTWTEAAVSNGSGQLYAGVWVATGPPIGDPVVTATQGGATANGMLLRVKVLTGVAAVQNGATATQSSTSALAHQASITTTVTGSQVYGALNNGASATAYTAAGTTTLFDNFSDGTNNEYYGSCRTTSPTGTPGATTVGASAPANAGGGCALLEILPNGTIVEDGSAPGVVTSTSATTVATSNFTPPPGSLLVAMVSSDGGIGITTMTVSGGGLTWTEMVHANVTSADYAGVWIAFVPPSAGGSPPADLGAAIVPWPLLQPILEAAAQRGGGATGAASATVDGTLAITDTITGTINVDPALSGTASATDTITGTLAIDLMADGTRPITDTLAGTLAVTLLASGSLALTDTITGTLAVTLLASGTRPTTDTITGTVAVDHTVSGSLAVTDTITGTLTVTRVVDGSLPVTATITGAFDVVTPGAVTVDGTRPTTDTITGTLAATYVMDGTRPTTVTIAGTAVVVALMAGTRPVTATIVGDITVVGPVVALTTTQISVRLGGDGPTVSRIGGDGPISDRLGSDGPTDSRLGADGPITVRAARISS